MKKLFLCKNGKLFNDSNEGEVLLMDNNNIHDNNKTKFFYPIITIIIFLLIIIIMILFDIYPHIKIDNGIKSDNVQPKKHIRVQYSKEEALQRGRNYLDKCLAGLLFNNQTITNFSEIKITVIIPLYNNEKMIKSVIRSIQNQIMKEIEIIIINDFSKDNSAQVIEQMQKEDPRIKLINNKKNLGILHSRAIGILQAKGKYILNLDHDDLFLDEDVFETVYYEAEDGNFDIISFIDIQARNYYSSVKKMRDGMCAYHPDNIIVYQPELTYYPIFKNEKFAFVDIRIWGKLISTEVYKNAINSLGKERYTVFNVINEDIIGLFAVCRVAKSYKYIRKYGIFHLMDKSSASSVVTHEHFMHMDVFFADILFDLSTNENKKYAAFIIIPIKTKKYFTLNNENTKLYLIKVIKKILNCKYIDDKYKNKIKNNFSDLPILAL